LYEPFVGYTTHKNPCKLILEKEELMAIMEENNFILEKSEQLDSWFLLEFKVKAE